MSSETAPGATTNGSVIHDIGFRHYEGARLGRGWAFRSLLVETIRGSFGIGRPAKVKAMPMVLLGFMTATAIIADAVTILTKADSPSMPYTQFAMNMWLLIAMFVAGRAPYAVSRDLRDGVLPLYLSRPLKRGDYVWAKLAGVSIATFLFIAVPLTLLLVGSLLAKLDAAHEIWTWSGSVLMAAVLAVLLSTLSLAVASFTKRRGFGVAAIMTLVVMAAAFAAIVVNVVNFKVSQAAGAYFSAFDPFALVDALGSSWLGVEPVVAERHPVGFLGGFVLTSVLVALVVLGITVLMRRFKKVGGV